VFAAEEAFFAFLETRPEFSRARDCRKTLVGPMRRHLRRRGAAAMLEWPDLPAQAEALIRARMAAEERLAEFCRRCGRCRLDQIFP
jgi:hypothetical protein